VHLLGNHFQADKDGKLRMKKIAKTIIFVFSLVAIFVLHNIVVNLAIGFSNPTITETQGGSFGSLEMLGFSHSVSVSVQRPFLFGLITLPVYINGVNVLRIHQFFLLLSIIAATLFIHTLFRKEKYAKEVIKDGKEISMVSVGYTPVNVHSVDTKQQQ